MGFEFARSSVHVRFGSRVVYLGSSDNVRDGSRDRRVALLYFRWRSSVHVRLDGRVIHRGVTGP